MSVSSTSFLTTYTGDGVTVAFPTGFPFMENGHLVVTRITLADGARTVLALGSQYTVTGASLSAGGTVTTMGAGSPLTSAYELEISRATTIVQPADFVANDGQDAETVEDGFDRLTMICQEISGQIAAIVGGGGGGPGAFTISNIPGAGAGWYSQQVGSDYQFKRLNTEGDLDRTGASGLIWSDSVGEVRMEVGGPHRMVNPQMYPDQAYRLQIYNFNEPLILEAGTDPGERYWSFTGGSGAPLMLHPMQYDFSGIGNSFIQIYRNALDAITQVLFNEAPIVLNDSGLQVTGGNVAVNDGMLTVNGTGQVLFNVLVACNAGLNINAGALFNGTIGVDFLNMNGRGIQNVGAFDFNETAKGTTGGAQTFDFSVANCYSITLNAASTWTFTPPAGATTTYIECTQDGTGSRVVTLPGAAKFTLATLAADKLASTGANKRDLYAFKWNAAGTACLTQIFKDW